MVRNYTLGPSWVPGHHGDAKRLRKRQGVDLSDLIDDDCCFACGAANPHGLHVRVAASDGECELRWEPRPEFQGYRGILHGGIASTLLDEAMAYACISLAGPCATASMSVRFRRPVSTESPIVVRATASRLRERVIEASAELLQGDEVMCTADSRFVGSPATR